VPPSCLLAHVSEGQELLPGNLHTGTSQVPQAGQAAEDEEEQHPLSRHESHGPRFCHHRRGARSRGHPGQQHGAVAGPSAEEPCCQAQATQPAKGRRGAPGGVFSSRLMESSLAAAPPVTAVTQQHPSHPGSLAGDGADSVTGASGRRLSLRSCVAAQETATKQ